MFGSMVKEWPASSFRPESCHLVRNPQHGGAFDGNACRKILHNVDILRARCPLHVSKYVNAFSSLNDVVHACLGCILRPDFVKMIELFKKNYLSSSHKCMPYFFMSLSFVRNGDRLVLILSKRPSHCIQILLPLGKNTKLRKIIQCTHKNCLEQCVSTIIDICECKCHVFFYSIC